MSSLGKNYFKVRMVFPGLSACTIESRRDVMQDLDSIEDMLREALGRIEQWKVRSARDEKQRRSRKERVA